MSTDKKSKRMVHLELMIRGIKELKGRIKAEERERLRAEEQVSELIIEKLIVDGALQRVQDILNKIESTESISTDEIRSICVKASRSIGGILDSSNARMDAKNLRRSTSATPPVSLTSSQTLPAYTSTPHPPAPAPPVSTESSHHSLPPQPKAKELAGKFSVVSDPFANLSAKPNKSPGQASILPPEVQKLINSPGSDHATPPRKQQQSTAPPAPSYVVPAAPPLKSSGGIPEGKAAKKVGFGQESPTHDIGKETSAPAPVSLLDQVRAKRLNAVDVEKLREERKQQIMSQNRKSMQIVKTLQRTMQEAMQKRYDSLRGSVQVDEDDDGDDIWD